MLHCTCTIITLIMRHPNKEIFSTKRCFYNDDCNCQRDAHLKVLLSVSEEGEEEEEDEGS